MLSKVEQCWNFKYLSKVEHFWTMLSKVEQSWAKLSKVEQCWNFEYMSKVEHCWAMLIKNVQSWTMLKFWILDQSWALLRNSEQSWTMMKFLILEQSWALSSNVEQSWVKSNNVEILNSDRVNTEFFYIFPLGMLNLAHIQSFSFLCGLKSNSPGGWVAGRVAGSAGNKTISVQLGLGLGLSLATI